MLLESEITKRSRESDPGEGSDRQKKYDKSEVVVLAPEIALVLAVFEDGLSTFCGRPSVRSTWRKGEREKLRQDAMEWVLNDDERWLYSFKSCCLVLGLDCDFWRKKALSAGMRKGETRVQPEFTRAGS
jgi:hypothetical protein